MMMMPTAKGKRLTFEVAGAGETPSHIRTDPNRLKQCLINLAGNAIKFTEQGYVRIKASLESDSGKGADFIRFDVKDTGIGIEKDKLESIFESFAQADGSSTRQYGGTGLGLTITRQLAGLLGGSISVASRLGEGSIFTLKIPVAGVPEQRE